MEKAIALVKLIDIEVNNFIAYLHKHKSRIHNYDYLQSEGIPIGSGAIESLVKRIDRRVQLLGTQSNSKKWNSKNLPQVLRQRSAYTATGWVQFGCRYALNYLPFLFIPIANGLLRMPRAIAWILIGTSILINTWGVYWAVKLGW